MRPIILKIVTNGDGNIVLSEEEFEKIVNKIYEQGVEDGQREARLVNPYINQQHTDPFILPIKCDVTATPCDATEGVIIDAVVQALGDENEDD